MEEMSACPCLLRAPNCQALILLHVDDLLVVGDYSFIELQLLPVLKEKYKLSMELMKEPGDAVTFLKRNHVLMSKTEMVIYPHEKHFHKLFDLLKIKRSWKPKNVILGESSGGKHLKFLLKVYPPDIQIVPKVLGGTWIV